MQIENFRDELNHKDIDSEEEDTNYTYTFAKRTLDLILSLMGVICLSPVFLIVGLIIKLDSRGPVIFSQKRIGKDGKEFNMYKLRSMVINAEELKKKLIDKN